VVFSDFGVVFGGCGVAISEDRPKSRNAVPSLFTTPSIFAQ
jgi:hypothetical protein